MTAYTEFFLGSKSNIVQLELIEISHPDFTKTYRFVRNASAGVTVTLETSATATFEYMPLRITPTSARDSLDQTMRVDVGDIGEVLPLELDAVAAGDGFDVKPSFVYRTYRSDDLTAPLFGPLVFEISAVSTKDQGTSFEAEAPKLSVLGTGEIYTLSRFPMLRGFI